MTKPRGTSNYSAAEQDRLLSVVAESLPRVTSEWQQVAAAYNISKGSKWITRTSASLKRKFTSMHTAPRKRKGGALTSREKTALGIRQKILGRPRAAQSRGGIHSASGERQDADPTVHHRDQGESEAGCRGDGAHLPTSGSSCENDYHAVSTSPVPDQVVSTGSQCSDETLADGPSSVASLAVTPETVLEVNRLRTHCDAIQLFLWFQNRDKNQTKHWCADRERARLEENKRQAQRELDAREAQRRHTELVGCINALQRALGVARGGQVDASTDS